MEAAQRVPGKRDAGQAIPEPLFEGTQVAGHLQKAALALKARADAALGEIAQTLEILAADADMQVRDPEVLEQRLTALEEKIVAILRAGQTDEAMLAIRQTLAAELRPYRSKMTADQLATLERRYLDTALLEAAAVPRLSLFYLQ